MFLFYIRGFSISSRNTKDEEKIKYGRRSSAFVVNEPVLKVLVGENFDFCQKYKNTNLVSVVCIIHNKCMVLFLGLKFKCQYIDTC